jgi:hypothetical protein
MAKRLKKSDLNDDQLNALEIIHKFLKAPDRRQMVLYGAAGTGKTSLINVLLDELEGPEYEDEMPRCVCTAPTNKAVEVIALATGRDFDKTIYSLSGLVLLDFSDGKPKLKKEHESHLSEYEVVIIDEASMVSNNLLNEIQRQLRTFTAIKVIYVGDRCQIPPVDDANKGYMESVIFQLPLKVELTKVMRTADQNPILGVVTKMREDMTSPVDLFEHETKVSEDGTGIYFYHFEKEFMRKMMPYFTSDEYKNDSNYAMAVAYTNAAVDAINERVRAAIYPDSTRMYEVGEEVRVVRTYGNDVHVGKGMIFSVIYNIEEHLLINSIEEVDDPCYHIPCFKVEVSNVVKRKKRKTNATAYIIRPDGLDAFYKLREELAIQAKERLAKEDLHGHKIYTPKEAWKDYSALNHYFLWVGYIYALTAHKSQGSTIQNVFVVERNINRIQENELRNKLKYTAFTRAAKELHVLV